MSLRHWTLRTTSVLLALLVALVAVPAAAWAFWTAGATGSGVASTADLTPPVVTVPSSAGSSVSVSWDAVQLEGGTQVTPVSGVRYSVQRSNGITTVPACGGQIYTTTSCSDTVASSGDYVYTVSAAYASWTSTATSAPVSVTAAAPTVTVSSPTADSTVNSRTPTFSGSASGTSAVTVRVYAGTGTTATAQQTLTATLNGSSWSATPTALADGTYTVQASQTNAAGTGASSAISFTVDATSPTAVDFSTVNGGTAGRIDVNDSLVFTFSERVRPTSLLAGWDGAARTTTFTVKDGNNQNDSLTNFSSGGVTVNLGAGVTLGSMSYISASNSPTATATMTLTTDASNRSVVTLKITALTANGNPTYGTVASATSAWASSTAVTDLAGNTASGNTVSQLARPLF